MRRRHPPTPPAVVEVPHLPLACFTGRLEHLLDAELRERWDRCAATIAAGAADPRAAAEAAADRAVYLDEMDRRRITPSAAAPPWRRSDEARRPPDRTVSRG